MKKYFYFLAIAVLFAACQPNNDLGTPFQKGQKVTLSATIANPDGGAKQMPGKQRVSGFDDTPIDPTNGAIKLTWNEGDQIKVTVNGVSATFTLKEGYDGSSTGEFEGTMPADGNSYTVTYPVEAPALTTQTYVENGFGEGLMAMSGEGTLEEGFILTATNALLGLHLTGSKALSDIVVTNSKTGDTYTLDCQGVTLKSEATSFYIVVPADEWENGFKVEVLQDDKSLISDFEKTSSATFTPNQAMAMPPKVADYELKTLTFEDADKQFDTYTLEYGDYPEICSWSQLIDDEQNSGALLYGGVEYGYLGEGVYYWWYDQKNTELKHMCENGYISGGHAISNHTSSDITSNTFYDTQLEVYGEENKGGNNGSTNFCVVNIGWGEDLPVGIFFEDGIPRVIDHMYINNIALSLNYFINGVADWSGNIGPIEDDETVTLVAYAVNEDGSVNEENYSEFYLCNGPENIIQKWTKWNLSELGKVYGLAFKFQKSNEYVMYATMFAYDDIAVRFPKE